MVEVEYDKRKHLENLEKRCLGFDVAAGLFNGTVVEALDERQDYGEDRFIALGMVDGRVLVVVYTWRQERRRIISARKANKDEQEIYHEALARYGPPDST
jgi:uncharacterized DUF497 family protein